MEKNEFSLIAISIHRDLRDLTTGILSAGRALTTGILGAGRGENYYR
jgi:hypothetical protein